MRKPSADRLIDATFLLMMPLLGWFAVFGHRGAAVVAGLSALAVAARGGLWREGLALLRPSRIAAAPLARAAAAGLLFAVWIAVTAVWSPTPGAPKLALTVAAFALCGGALVYEAARSGPARVRRMAGLYAGAVAVAAGALLFEGLTGGLLRALVPPTDQTPGRWKDLTALARGVTYVAPLVFPAAAILFALTRSRWMAAAPVLFALIAATQFTVAANVAALLFAIGAGAVALWRPAPTVLALGTLFIASLLLAPLFALAPADAVLQADNALMPASWAQRVNLWKESAERITGGCFFAGCGADYTRAWAAESAMIAVPGWPVPLMEAPIHPHNVFLQIWLELGVPGVLTIGAAMAFGLIRLLDVPPRRTAFAAIAALGAAAYISFMFEASLWQAWRVAILSLAAFGAALSYSLYGWRST